MLKSGSGWVRQSGEIVEEIRETKRRLREAKERRERAAAEKRDLKGRLDALVKEMLSAHVRDERATRAVAALIASMMVVTPAEIEPAPLQEGPAVEAGASKRELDRKEQT
jgi:endonuclease III